MITTSGLDQLGLDLAELAELPDDVIFDMLEAEGEVVVEAQKRKLASIGLVDTGRLRDSIKVDRKRIKRGSERAIDVYPHGKRDSKTTNQEVAFIHEFGAPGRNIPAKQWMRTANEECADEAVAAAEKVYDDYLKSKNL